MSLSYMKNIKNFTHSNNGSVDVELLSCEIQLSFKNMIDI